MAFRRVVTFMAVALAVAGCAGVWGNSYKVELKSLSSITITYDPGLTNISEIRNVAQVHCAEFHADATSQGSQDSTWGFRNTSFICKPRVELRRED